MSSHISYRNLIPIIISGQSWIRVQTYMYFAVISAMRTQATSRCQSLAKYFGSIVDVSTWCLVHWNAEVPPTSGFDQSCFTDRSRFTKGPILVWIPAHGFLLFLPLHMGIYAHPSAKDAEMREYLASIFFSHENCYIVDMAYFETTCCICRYDFGFPLTGDILPLPGDIPRSK